MSEALTSITPVKLGNERHSDWTFNSEAPAIRSSGFINSASNTRSFTPDTFTVSHTIVQPQAQLCSYAQCI